MKLTVICAFEVLFPTELHKQNSLTKCLNVHIRVENDQESEL